MDVKFKQEDLKKLLSSKEVAGSIDAEAANVRSRVRVPRSAGLTISMRNGVSKKGAFAQVIMRGRAALAIEFGSRKNPPYAPLRRALR